MMNKQLVKKIESLPDEVQQAMLLMPVSQLVALVMEKATPQTFQRSKAPSYGALKGKIRMADDFDAPVDGFGAYMP